MIYLDNSATTPVREEVYSAMEPYLKEEYGNPSSKYYTTALHAQEAVENSRYQVAALLNVKPDEIIFTAGSTESTNMIIKGVADYKKYYEDAGNHIITSKVEHHATLNTCRFLNGEIYSNRDAIFSLGGRPKVVNRGYEVTFLDVNEYGQVDVGNFESSIKDSTILASFIWGNNEIASLNDIDSLYQAAHKRGVLLHADATQVLGKIPIDLSQTPVDYLSCSAHKLYGPKGVGAAFMKSDDYGILPITSLLHGGEQEYGIRAGTLAVHNIVGFGKAAELAKIELDKKQIKIQKIDKEILEYIGTIEEVELLGDPVNRIPGIYSIVVKNRNFSNERFLKKVSEHFAVSTGSACALGEPSHVLKAIGREEDTGRVIRISSLNKEDIEMFMSVLRK
ncbi:cysteine desulfurase family protein [Agathobacter sp.]